MNQLKIAIRIPLAAAIARSSPNFGETSVELVGADLVAMSEAARDEIAHGEVGNLTRDDKLYSDTGSFSSVYLKSVGYEGVFGMPLRLEVKSSDVADIKAAIEAQAEARAQAVTAAKEQHEANILVALAVPVEQWIGEDWAHGPYVHMSVGLYSDKERKDPRIVELRERISRDVLPARVAAFKENRAAAEAQRQAEAAEREGIERRFADAARRYVIDYAPDYARAARERASVIGVMKETLLDLEGKALIDSGFTLIEAQSSPLNQERPRHHAYETLDRVNLAIGPVDLDSDLMRSVEAKIVRVDTCPELKCTAGFRTAVVITFTFTDGSAEYLYVDADSDSGPKHEHPTGG